MPPVEAPTRGYSSSCSTPASGCPCTFIRTTSSRAKRSACPYGKTEAWIVIGTAGPTATMYVGFRDEVSGAALEGWVRDQDAAAMLDALNPVDVQADDVLFVPGGIPHAIGEGALSSSCRSRATSPSCSSGEGSRPKPRRALGLGWDVALQCVDRSATDPDRLHGHRLPAEANRFFRAERVEASPSAELEPGFAILVFTEGAADLLAEDGKPLRVGRGDTVLVPVGRRSLPARRRSGRDCLPTAGR